MRLGLTAVLILAAGLRLWRLDQNGFGNEYYAAGVRSMSASMHNFLYHAFDPAGFLSVDKPPVAMWLQVASVKVLGFHGLSVLLPQVVEGLAAVWILYHLVTRQFGPPAGLLAALFLAMTPVSVAVDRSSNTESCLILTLLLAAWALFRAAEEGRRRFFVLAMALVGLAFNVKMLAAFVVLPTFVLVYLGRAPDEWRRRVADVAIGGLVLVVVSFAWVAVYDLTPPQKRPYAGTTDTNSELALVVGEYGIGRFVRPARSSVTGTITTGRARPETIEAARDGAQPRARRGAARLFVGTPAGPLRLLDGQLAGQVEWWLPLALAGLVLGALREPWRRGLSSSQASLALWSGWALTYAVVFSVAGGFFHYYYMAMLAPPLAALAGIGAMSLWRMAVAGGGRTLVVTAVLLLGAGWQLVVDARALAGYDGWQMPLHAALLGGALLATGGLVVFALPRPWGWPARGVALGAFATGLAALLLVPGAWALSSVLVAGHGVLPAADLALLLDQEAVAGARARRTEMSANVSRLIAFLREHRQGERYLLATSTTMLAAPIIIETGEAVMARGGFHGLDPIVTPAKLRDMVAAKQVRFVMLGDFSFASRRLGGETAQREIAEWVRANGTLVDPARWRASASAEGAMRLYDLRRP